MRPTHLRPSIIFFTASLDDLSLSVSSILNKNFPDKFIVSFGYTGWSSGQLEKEIQQGSWVIIPANEQIIFSTKSDKKIEEASKLAGFNLNLVSSNYGKA